MRALQRKRNPHNKAHCIIYSTSKEAELRTSENFEKCAQLATLMQTRIDRERTLGINGLSAFSEILDVPLPHSVVIDVTRTVFLYHSKKLLIHLQTYIKKENLSKINLKPRSMNFIHDVRRRPRSFKNEKHLKCNYSFCILACLRSLNFYANRWKFSTL